MGNSMGIDLAGQIVLLARCGKERFLVQGGDGTLPGGEGQRIFVRSLDYGYTFTVGSFRPTAVVHLSTEEYWALEDRKDLVRWANATERRDAARRAWHEAAAEWTAHMLEEGYSEGMDLRLLIAAENRMDEYRHLEYVVATIDAEIISRIDDLV